MEAQDLDFEARIRALERLFGRRRSARSGGSRRSALAGRRVVAGVVAVFGKGAGRG